MDLSLIFKIAAVGLIVAILQQILAKLGRDDYGTMLVLAGIVIILLMLVPQMLNLLQTVQSVLPF